jgi:hypothetical protein
VGAVWAVRSLPWWALVVGFVVLVVVGKFAVKRLVKKLFLAPFKMKGGVLNDASVQVHSVVPCDAPTRTDAEESDPAKPNVPRRYFKLDVTIQPKETTGNFTCWEPGELSLVGPLHVVDPESDERDEEDSCDISELQYEEDGVFKDDEGFKFQGPKRLKMTLAVREGVDNLQFQYYFEQFGQVQLPGGAFKAAA